MRQQALHPGAILALSLLLAGCQPGPEPGAADGGETGIGASVRAAMAAPDRPAADRERDAARKPAEVLEFLGLEPGMTVLDMFSGGGYYTELVAAVVGPEGEVHAHNNQPYLSFAADDLAQRYTERRLTNVTRITAENNELELAPATYDMALLVLAYHDVYYVDEPNGWYRIDAPRMLAEIHQAMKPGAVLGVVDHVAAAGSPAEATAQNLHRIDPDLLRADLEAAGFRFDASTDILRNPDDDHEKPMFDPSVRGNTDRIVYRFVRP